VTAIGIDSGTGETKIILFKMEEGGQVLVQELAKLASLRDLLMNVDKGDLSSLTKRVNEFVAVHNPTELFAGVTAWYRSASREEKTACDRFFTEHLPQFKYLTLGAEEETRLEAGAVRYAATKSNLGVPDMQIAAGGGSMNLVQGDKIYGIAIGFRKGQNELMGEEPRANVVNRLREDAQTQIALFKKNNPEFVVRSNMMIIGISAAYYAAAGVDLHLDKSVMVKDILPVFTEKRDKLILGHVDSSKPLGKKVAQEIANLIIFCEFYAQLVHPEAFVYFKRNWILAGVPFTTTWSAGHFLTLTPTSEQAKACGKERVCTTGIWKL